jgi:hypothetical protein
MTGGKSIIGDALGIVAADARTVAIDYLRNEVAANKTYQGKVAVLRGRALSIQAGPNAPFIEFAHSGEWGVRAYFDERDTDALAKVRRLDPVEVVCRGAGVVIGVPIFKNCVMASEWRQSVLADVSKDVDDFFTVGASTTEAAFVATLSTAIASTLPPGSLCSASDSPCDGALNAFQGLSEGDQRALISRAAQGLKRRGLAARERP